MNGETELLEMIRGELKLLRESQERQLTGIRLIYKKLESILSHLESLDAAGIQTEAYLKDIKGSAFITQIETMRQRKSVDYDRDK